MPAASRPRIGVLASPCTAREGGWSCYAADALTITALCDAGGLPAALPAFSIIPGLAPADLVQDMETFRGVFDQVFLQMVALDGLVLVGDGDVETHFLDRLLAPAHGEHANEWLLTWEWFSTLIAYVLGTPVFGVGRGMQVINAVLGGRVMSDAQRRSHTRSPRLVHSRRRPGYAGHPLCIVPRTWLAEAVGGSVRVEIARVPSRHRRVIGLVQPGSGDSLGQLASELCVVGYAPDGVIEAVGARETCRPLWGVQCHPEAAREYAWAHRLFQAVVASAARAMNVPRSVYESCREELFGWLWRRAREQTTLPAPLVRYVPQGENAPGAPAERTTDEYEPLPHALRVG